MNVNNLTVRPQSNNMVWHGRRFGFVDPDKKAPGLELQTNFKKISIAGDIFYVFRIKSLTSFDALKVRANVSASGQAA